MSVWAFWTLPAHAMLDQVTFERAYDGTAGFDGSDGPGLDSGSRNDIVRTHDEVGYAVTLRSSSTDEAPTVTLTLPLHDGRQVASWNSLPTFCLASGSSLSDGGRTLVCRLEDFKASGTRTVNFPATIQSQARNNDVLGTPTLRVTSAKAPGGLPPANQPAPIRISAAPFYDVHIEMSYAGSPKAVGAQDGSGPNGESGYYHRPMIGLIARNPNGHGKKGVEALGPGRVEIDLNLNVAGYDQLAPVINWDKGAKGSYTDGCGSATPGFEQIPGVLSGDRVNTYDRITDKGPVARSPSIATDVHTVVNGGDCQFVSQAQQSSGTRYTIAIAGMDTSLAFTPTHRSRTGRALPADEFWVANKALVLWTPMTAYPPNTQVNHTFSATAIRGTSISGQSIQGDRLANNSIDYPVTARNEGTAEKAYSPDSSLPVPYATYRDPAISGDHIVNYMAPGQTVRALLRHSNSGAITHTDVVLCDILDRSAFDLGSNFLAEVPTYSLKDAGAVTQIRYGAPPAGASRYFASTDSAPGPYEVRGSGSVIGTSAYAQASCKNPDIRWFDTPQQAEAAGGLVYVRGHINRVLPSASGNLIIQGLILRSTWAETVSVQTPTATVRRKGAPIEAGTLIRNRGEIEAGNYTHGYPYFRDHLQVVESQTLSSITKEIIQPATGNTAPIDAGKTLTYRLTPFYSTLFPPKTDTVTVTDILPPGASYRKGSATLGGQPSEPEIRLDTPNTGQTTLIWTYPERTPYQGANTDPGAALPAIEFEAELSPMLPDDRIIRNVARTGDRNYNQERSCIYNAGRGEFVSYNPYSNVTGSCPRATISEIRIKSQPNIVLQKSTSVDTIEPGDPFDYSLRVVAIGQTLRTPDLPDLIDILPFEGDGDTRTSHDFQGREPASTLNARAYRLVSVTPSALDPNARIYYTKRPPREIHNGPQHSSNRIPGGETRWCLASELGQPGCPADIGESTAVRISPTLTTLGPAQPYDVRLNLISDPVLAVDGSRFANHVVMQPADPRSALLLVQSQAGLYVQVKDKTGSLSGRVFADVARNGSFEEGDWALPNQCVQLSGTTDKGHSITLSTRTDAEGRYNFGKAQANSIHASADCSGEPMPIFGGLMSGNYALTRSPADAQPPAGGIHAGSAGGTVAGTRIHSITIAEGAEGTDYNFTEHPALPRLSLLAQVRNDHGGQATPDQAQLSARQPDSANAALQGQGGAATLNDIEVPAGRYQLAGSVLSGYRQQGWSCTVNGNPVPLEVAAGAGGQTADSLPVPSLPLSYGDVGICTLVYDDQPARLTLVKTVTNSNGRTAVPGDFRLHADGPSPLSGFSGSAEVTAVDVLPGSYTLREDNLPNYVAGAWQCSAGTLTDSTLALGNGEEATCTINNTDQPVSLTLVLDILNEHGGTAQPADAPLQAEGPDQVQGISGTRPVTVAPVRPGVYELGEPVLPGYRTGKWVCSGGVLNGSTLTLSDQQNVTCRIELKDIPAELKVSKQVEGTAQPVEGTDSDYWVGYTLTVQHEAGADGLYDLSDLPAFDADVQIIDTRASRNGQPLTLPAAQDGRWTLASGQRLAIGAEDVYQMQFRIRVPYGSNTANNSCATAGAAEGQGLFNRLSLNNRAAEAADAPALSASACLDTPVPISKAALSIEKTSASRSAEVGDLITYRLRIRNNGSGTAISPVVVDRLPRGFNLEPNSLRVQGATRRGVQISGNRELRIQLDRIEAGTSDPSAASQAAANGADNGSTAAGEVLISYRVRLGVGAQEGDGTNRAHVECPTPNGASTARCSNESRWKVQVKAGIFSEEACLAGQIFVDCNGNSLKDAEELGIPGVRLYLQNGTWLVSDEHGKYSHCGLRPRTHVLKVDSRTLPRRARLVTSSAQNAGDAESLFIDARKGMLHRADFIEGSCSATVIEQVKARQAQGANTSVQTEPGQPGLSFDSKQGIPARPLREGTDGAVQARPQQRH